MFWDQSDAPELFYQWNYSGIIVILYPVPCSCDFYTRAEIEVAASIIKQTCCAWSRSVSHLLGKSTQWQLKGRLRVFNRERKWESLREERMLSATRERRGISPGPDGTKKRAKKRSGVSAVTSTIFYLLLSVSLGPFFGQAIVGAWLFEQWQLLGTALSKMHSQEHF